MRYVVILSLSVILYLTGCSSGITKDIPVIGKSESKNEKRSKADLRTTPNEPDKPLIGGVVGKTGIENGKDTPEDRDAAARLIDTTGWHPALAGRTSTGAPYGYLVCAKSQAVLKATDYDDFSDIFTTLCDQEKPNKTFESILNLAFTGAGEPKISTHRLRINELFVTDYIYSFAVKVPVSSPGDLGAYPIYEEISKGLKTPDSLLIVTKGKEATFPGKGVVRSLEQSYSMPMAKGAGLYDQRKTLSNTYLLVEGSQDVNLTAEHMLNPDTTEYYNASRQIILGIKSETPGFSYQVYITQLVVVNRFDPERLTAASSELSALIPKAVLRVVK